MSLVGTPAPQFSLVDQHGVAMRLAEQRPEPVLVFFFPFAFTGICTGELTALRDDEALARRARIVGVSCDSMFALRAFADQHDLHFPLLSDHWPHGAVASAYGVFDADRGCALRGTFVIDSGGIVRWEAVHAASEARDVTRYHDVLDQLGLG